MQVFVVEFMRATGLAMFIHGAWVWGLASPRLVFISVEVAVALLFLGSPCIQRCWEKAGMRAGRIQPIPELKSNSVPPHLDVLAVSLI